MGSLERVQRGFVKFWVVRPHAGSAPPLLCHHLGMRQMRARCSSAPPWPGWAPLDPWCTSLGKRTPGRYHGGTMQRNERCDLSGRPTRRVKSPGRRQNPAREATKERWISGNARTARRALVVLAAIGGHVTPQPNHNWCGCVVCDCARRCAALGKGAFLCKVVMIMVGAVGA